MAGGTDSRVYVFDMRSGSLLRTIITTPHHALVSCVQATKNDDFLVTAGKTPLFAWQRFQRHLNKTLYCFPGESRLAYWNFRDVGLIEFEKEAVTKQTSLTKRSHSVPISCVEISIDGTIAVTGI